MVVNIESNWDWDQLYSLGQCRVDSRGGSKLIHVAIGKQKQNHDTVLQAHS